MIAANDMPLGELDALAPDQLGALIARAAGLLAHRASAEHAARVLRNTARALDRFSAPQEAR